MTQFPNAVPKPQSAGAPQSAIAITKNAYVNVRNGPSTRHRDIGDLRNNTLVAHYPSTRTGDGWVWIEQFSAAGWVSTSVLRFEPINAEAPTTPIASPYDEAVAVWHWRGDSVQENSIEEYVRALRASSRFLKQVWVKTSDYTPQSGAQWMGYWDTKRGLAIDGVASIDRWAQVLAQNGLELHIWMVPRGLDLERETNLVIEACKRPNVKSLILDVEPYDGFWSGGQAGIRPYMTRIRRALPGNFHIGLSVDPRDHHYDSIFPQEWAPFVNSVHPQVYWATMRRQPGDVLAETYETWGGYGKPIIPALQGDADSQEMETARTLAIGRYGAKALSWWRAGVIGPVEWQVVDRPIDINSPPPPPPKQTVYGEEQVVKPDEPGFMRFSYTGEENLATFTGTWGWTVYYKVTETTASKVAARWAPQLKASGKYDISVFVPARHATSLNARYKVHGIKGAQNELQVPVNQDQYFNQWVSLGVFDLDKSLTNTGAVFLNDLTGETNREIAFDAVRWTEVIEVSDDTLSEGFDQPMGTSSERRSLAAWAGQWYDASPFGKLYLIGTSSEAYHTGADLNLPRDADAHTPVYATASGVVKFAARIPIWGNIIIIRHDPLSTTGMVMYSRYAHVEALDVKVGQRVMRGQQICKVGNAFGRFAYHLHFDLSPTTILEQEPSHWPKRDYESLMQNYVDPKEFINNNRPRRQ